MARTFVQQSQISGSLEFNDTLAAGSGLAGKQTLVGDLDALRSQINKIIGGSNWYDALSGSQDLADIYAAVHMTGTAADFMGTLDVTGVATFDSAITGSAGLQLGGDLDVNSTADIQGAVNLQSTLTVGGAVDVNAAMDVSGQVDLAAAGVATNVRGTLSVTEVASFTAAITGSAGLKLAGDADFNGGVAATEIKIDGDSANVGYLYLVGASGEIAEEQDLIWTGDLLKVTGSIGVTNGINVAGGGLTVQGDRLEVTGSMGITGAVDFDSTLNVDGIADFKADVYMAADLGVSGSLVVQYNIDAVDATLSGDLSAVSGSFSGDLDVAGDLSAKKISIDSDVATRLYIVGGDGSLSDEAKLTFDGSELVITGSLKATSAALIEGNLNVDGAADFDSSADFAGAVVMQSSLDVDGAVDFDSTLDVAGNATFRANVDVVGNLTVQGTTTYIETANLKVLDAFIHLATGSTGTQNSGIVLHGGAGASADLMLAQDGGAGEFVFAKLTHGPDHDLVDGDNLVPVNGAELVSAWMSSVKLGGVEGSLSGSLAAYEDGIRLLSEAGKDLFVEAASDLLLAGNGASPLTFISGSAEYGSFMAQFPGYSLVGAIVAAGGNFKQDSFKPGITVAGNNIAFNPAVGQLRSGIVGTAAAEKVAMDVYLNGVRLVYSDDYTIHSVTQLRLAMDTMVDDVLTVVIHNAL